MSLVAAKSRTSSAMMGGGASIAAISAPNGRLKPAAGGPAARSPAHPPWIQLYAFSIRFCLRLRAGSYFTPPAPFVTGEPSCFQESPAPGRLRSRAWLRRTRRCSPTRSPYIRPGEGGYRAFGTPFAGELGIPGANVSAPIKALYLLAQGPENRVDPLPRREAASALLRNTLFFAKDPGLVRLVFEAVCRFVVSVPIYRLTFSPTPRVWELIA